MVAVWWSASVGEIQPWTPSGRDQDRANVLVYRLGSGGGGQPAGGPGAAAEPHIQSVPAGLVDPVGHLMVVTAQVTQLHPSDGIGALTVEPHPHRCLVGVRHQNLTERITG